MPRKFLIVGAGLSGTLTAWELRKRAEDFIVYDSGAASASRVAAGLFNPVSFKRIVEVWNAEEHMRMMLDTYSEIESSIGAKILNKTSIMRVFPNKQYRDHWQARIEKKHDVAKWLSPIFNKAPEGVVAPFGVGYVEEAGWVNLPAMIDGVRKLLVEEERFKQRSWSISDSVPQGFDIVIDCRGVGAKVDLNKLGYKLAADHGEVLTMKSESLDLNGNTLNRVKWLMPFEKETFKLGATYEWGVEESKPTESGKKEIIEALSSAISKEIFDKMALVNHQSGLRPTSHDRRPYVGEIQPGVFTLNGLGTRGVLVAPATVKRLVSNLF